MRTIGLVVVTLLMMVADGAILLFVMWFGWKWFVLPVVPALALRPLPLYGLCVVVRFLTRGHSIETSEEYKKLATLEEKIGFQWGKTFGNLIVALTVVGMLFLVHLAAS